MRAAIGLRRACGYKPEGEPALETSPQARRAISSLSRLCFQREAFAALQIDNFRFEGSGALLKQQNPQNESARLSLIAETQIVHDSARLDFRANRRGLFVLERLAGLAREIPEAIFFLSRCNPFAVAALA